MEQEEPTDKRNKFSAESPSNRDLTFQSPAKIVGIAEADNAKPRQERKKLAKSVRCAKRGGEGQR